MEMVYILLVMEAIMKDNGVITCPMDQDYFIIPMENLMLDFTKYDQVKLQDGYLNGYGFANYSNGDTYEGYFLDGNMEGFGLLYNESENEFTLGFYKGNEINQLVETLKNKKFGDVKFSIDNLMIRRYGKTIHTKHSKNSKTNWQRKYRSC